MVATELPELTIQDIYCSMTEEQQVLYEVRKSEIRNYLTDRLLGIEDPKNRFLVLSSLMKLRLLACHPSLAQQNWEGGSGKFEQVTEMLSQIVSEGHKVLVFSQFVKHLNIVGAYLQSQNITFVSLTGQQSQTSRNKSISDFSKPSGAQVFLITLKAGGTGLNLTQAGYVFLLDPWWNPAAEMQAINRAHRIGQQNKVIAYRFITTASIEEKIQKLQAKKQNLADVFVNTAAETAFSQADLIGLLQGND
jgi:SNF2 family DNA or RNA helicase